MQQESTEAESPQEEVKYKYLKNWSSLLIPVPLSEFMRSLLALIYSLFEDRIHANN